MPSSQDTKTDPHDVLEIAPDVVLVARAAAEFPSLAPDPASQPFHRQPNMGTAEPAAAAPKLDTRFRASDVNDIAGQTSGNRWLRTAGAAFLFAFLSVVATAAWQRYGDEAQALVQGLTSRVDLASWLPWQKSAVAARPDPSASPTTAAADQAATAAPAGQAADTGTNAPQGPTPTLQSVSNDVASLTQQVEALKASIVELKASQEQLSRDIAKPRETKPVEARLPETRPAEPRPTKLGAPPRPLGAIVQHKPKPPTAYPPMQATAATPLPPPGYGAAPVQIAPAPPPAVAAETSEDGVVVRPPMPVR